MEQRPIGHRRTWTAWLSLCWVHPITNPQAVNGEVSHLGKPMLRNRLAVEVLAVGIVALTGHLGGFLSGVNGPG
jgi:hypothetical protein